MKWEHCGHLLAKEINEACEELTPHLFRAQRTFQHQLRVTLIRPRGKHLSLMQEALVCLCGGWAARNSRLKAVLSAQQTGRGQGSVRAKQSQKYKCDTLTKHTM